MRGVVLTLFALDWHTARGDRDTATAPWTPSSTTASACCASTVIALRIARYFGVPVEQVLLKDER